ncbi:MAG: amidase domain-containing protein, partial [Clostridiales bacterium]|nr:amidase domain-containing protein [Clostridiales bacterium]
PENNTKNHGWYYRNWAYRTPSWSGVNELYRFLTADAPRSGPVATEAPPDTLVPGDVIQLSFAGQRYGHSLLVVAVGADGIRIATHTYDADYRRLESYDYKTARGLHVLGAT